MVGSGLWGPIWGNMAIKSDMSSIFGAKFDHKGETPGLGAEIVQPFFYKQFESESISEAGAYKQIKIVKDGSGS
jgi:Na+-transporting NADH:ubiquinone oxidoreductase subunit C